MIKDQDLLYQLLCESRLDLMWLPPGAIAWLFDRPESQIDGASKLGILAKDVNPITSGAVLKADQNILILKTDDGHKFHVYPDGGYSVDGHTVSEEEVMSILNSGVEEPSPCDMAEPPPDAPEGFDSMTVGVGPVPGEEGGEDVQGLMSQLLAQADDVEEGHGDMTGGPYTTYDELASSAARDISAHPNEDLGDDDDEIDTDYICKLHGMGDEPEFMKNETEGSQGDAGPLGGDTFDSEDEIPQMVSMQDDAEEDEEFDFHF